MEAPNENQLSNYYAQPQQHHQISVAEQPTDGLLRHQGSSDMVSPHSVPSAVPEPAKRKRGRPRKYGTPEQALAAKKPTSSASKDHPQGSGLGGGASGQGITPHVIDVVAGEDVSQKIMVFVQQSKHEICVLSASGSVANPTLRQSTALGGSITYEGQFEIVSLSGSYIHNEVGGRSGGISVCLCSADGQFIGGVVAGSLNAAGPVQIIVGTFLSDTKKDVGAGAAQGGDALLMSGVGGSNYWRNPISSGGNDNDQTIGGDHHFMSQSQAMDMIPAHPIDWSSGYDLTDTNNDD